jgi:hypothetical protein
MLGSARKSISGTALLEILLASTLLMVFTGGALLMASTSSKAFGTGATSSDLNSRTRRTVAEVCDLLRLSNAEGVWPPGVEAPDSTPLLEFQRSRGYQAGGIDWDTAERLVLEYDPRDPNDGLDNDGDGLIDEGQLVWIDDFGQPDQLRRILCHDVAEFLEGEDSGNLADDNGNGLQDERGFCVDFDGSVATVHLTLESVDPGGFTLQTTIQRTVAFRNTID